MTCHATMQVYLEDWTHTRGRHNDAVGVNFFFGSRLDFRRIPEEEETEKKEWVHKACNLKGNGHAKTNAIDECGGWCLNKKNRTWVVVVVCRRSRSGSGKGSKSDRKEKKIIIIIIIK